MQAQTHHEHMILKLNANPMKIYIQCSLGTWLKPRTGFEEFGALERVF